MRARALPSEIATLAFALACSPLGGCARLPALAIAGRLHVVTEPHAAAQSMAVIVGCGWQLERDAVARVNASANEPPPGVAANEELPGVGCVDEALCAWQRSAELGAAQVLLPMTEETRP